MSPSKLETLGALLNSHGARVEQLVARLNAEPTPDAAAACTVEHAGSVFLACYGKLSDQELTDALTFSDSNVGKKEAQVARSVAQKFGALLKGGGSLKPTPPAEEKRKVRELIRIQGIGETMKGLATTFRVSASQLEDLFVSSYAAELNDAEVDELLSFYKSSAGQKSMKASRDTIWQISKLFGL